MQKLHLSVFSKLWSDHDLKAARDRWHSIMYDGPGSGYSHGINWCGAVYDSKKGVRFDRRQLQGSSAFQAVCETFLPDYNPNQPRYARVYWTHDNESELAQLDAWIKHSTSPEKRAEFQTQFARLEEIKTSGKIPEIMEGMDIDWLIKLGDAYAFRNKEWTRVVAKTGIYDAKGEIRLERIQAFAEHYGETQNTLFKEAMMLVEQSTKPEAPPAPPSSSTTAEAAPNVKADNLLNEQELEHQQRMQEMQHQQNERFEESQKKAQEAQEPTPPPAEKVEAQSEEMLTPEFEKATEHAGEVGLADEAKKLVEVVAEHKNWVQRNPKTSIAVTAVGALAAGLGWAQHAKHSKEQAEKPTQGK